MKIIKQKQYRQPDNFKSLSYQPLIIHRRQDSELSPDHALIVLTHGLGGARYGKNSTWGNIPAFLFEDFPHADIGIYDYRTLWGRAKFWQSVDLETEAGILAEVLRDETDYSQIILLGHSMGGLLCMGALTHLYTTNLTEHLSRIAGLLLLAVPQTGSQRVPKWLTWFSKDFRALKPHGAFVTRIQQIVTDAFSLDEKVTSEKPFTIPTWAVLAGADAWVDRLSAAVNLPTNRRKTVRGTHTSIVKPPSKDADAYQFIKKCIQTALEAKASQNEPPSGQNSLHQASESHENEPEQNEKAGSKFSVHAKEVKSVTQAENIDTLNQNFGDTYNAEVKGSGAVAQGPGSTVAGKGGMAIGGNVSGSITNTSNANTVAEKQKKEK